MEKISKDEAKNRMKCNIFNYISEREALEAVISQDSVKLEKMKALCDRLCTVNDKMVSDIDAADPQEFERLVGAFTYPVDSLDG